MDLCKPTTTIDKIFNLFGKIAKLNKPGGCHKMLSHNPYSEILQVLEMIG